MAHHRAFGALALLLPAIAHAFVGPATCPGQLVSSALALFSCSRI